MAAGLEARVAGALTIREGVPLVRRLAGHAPEQLIVSLMITAMELSFVIGEEEDKGTRNRLSTICAALEYESEGWPDWYDRAIMHRYLREESPYLKGAWSPRQYDRIVGR